MQAKLCAALFLGANFLAPSWSSEVFRCGTTFSDLPCPSGVSSTTAPIDPDPRSRAQAQHSQRNTQAQQAAAQQLQTQRQREEARASEAQRLAAMAPPPPPPQVKPLPAWQPRRRYGPPSPYFTARDADTPQQLAHKKK